MKSLTPENAGLSLMGQRTSAPPISWLMQLALSRQDIISLAVGFTDNASLPVRETRDLIEDLLSSNATAPDILQYGTGTGNPDLRSLVADRTMRADKHACNVMDAGGVHATPAQDIYAADATIITNGSQQLLYMINECLCDPGDIVLVEDPTYFVFLSLGQSHGIEFRGVQLDIHGASHRHLEEVLENAKMNGTLPRVKYLYTPTYFQNPTGITTPFSRKIRLLETLRNYEKDAGHPLYLVEDAAYRELRFSGEDTPSSLASSLARDRVIYTGTFSKPFATGIRVGFGILPHHLHETIARIKGNHDFGTSNLLQHILRRALVTGKYDAHLQTLQERYSFKSQLMLEALQNYFPNSVSYRIPKGGLYFWVEIPNAGTGLNSDVFASALKQNVLYLPGDFCFADDPTRTKPDNHMRISFGGATDYSITNGIKRIGNALRECRIN
ncbi:MAG: PLP-dependent aminotransferase family protein [Verrucomicrobia bacterium]|nr:PLP-dependent aminotransferase family protein [Verrucomicrobiota bacterium]MCF7708261.1 PLP-dependent aminotransferase family protein [Verrucomicrobiota bacterium]